MYIVSHHPSPVGDILLASDADALIGLWIEGQQPPVLTNAEEGENAPILAAKAWLNCYFGGKIPNVHVPIRFCGTPFQVEVWEILSHIPYGTTVTYGEIAKTLSARHGCRMSAQAVGGAVGRNPISIIIPCHRVMGAHGKLTGYAGGIDKKRVLLEREGIDTANFILPK